MKYLAITVLGLVLLAAICGIVLRANMPTAKLTVHAVRPVGRNVNWVTSPESVEHWPVWDFAVTNTGQAPAEWIAYLHFKGGDKEWLDMSAWSFDPRGGVLSNGESTTIQIGVPADSRTPWAVTLKYRTFKSPIESKLYGWLKPVPKLRRLLPNDGDHFAADAWHVGTNVTAAR
jgi:hypothetical protein